MATTLDSTTAKKLEAFYKNVRTSAEDVVFTTFPNKVLDLHALIESTKNDDSIFHQSHAHEYTDVNVYPGPLSSTATDEPDVKKRKRLNDGNGVTSSPTETNGSLHPRYPDLVRSNTNLVRIHSEVKKECEELWDLCDKVKLWVNINMPKIEDGDNFGVQIQEEVLTELHRAQESAYNVRDVARQDYLNRAKICSKIVKYPHIEDYKLALKEHDDKQVYVARQHLVDIRNVYAVLTDVLHKNITKIRSPKGNNSIGLY